jgi:hypothetical protein
MISAVVLIGSGVFSYMNKKTLEETKGQRVTAQTSLAASLKQLAGKRQDLADTEDETKNLQAEDQTLKTELTQAELKSSNNDLMIANLTTEEKTIVAALTKAEAFVASIGEIEKLRVEMAERATQIQEKEVAIASLRGQVSAGEERSQKLDAVRLELQAVEDDRSKGIIRGEFATTIKKAFNNWGFVVIDAGDNQGVVSKAQLDVLRRGQPICKLLVTAVEPGEAVAEVINGSMQPGQAIQEGDTVTKSTTLIPGLGPDGGVVAPTVIRPAGGGGAANPALLPPADGGAGGMGAPGGAGGDPDPFAPAGGGMTTPAPAPTTEPDPFAPAGGMGGAAPAPAPAPAPGGDADPFAPAGAGMSGEAPAPGGAAEADPFAPAGGGAAPAPAPAGDGPAMEDDPFAPK